MKFIKRYFNTIIIACNFMTYGVTLNAAVNERVWSYALISGIMVAAHLYLFKQDLDYKVKENLDQAKS